MFDGDYVKVATWMNTFYKNVPQEYAQIIGFASDDVNTQNKLNIIRNSIRDFLKSNSDDQYGEQITF